MSLLTFPQVQKCAHAYVSRRLISRLLSTFMCCLLIVFRGFSRLAGPSAFLILTFQELVFSSQSNIAEQIEVTVLNVTGGVIGVGSSALSIYLASLTHPNANASRAILALSLTVISFAAGFIKSRLPRLSGSARIGTFIVIWMLSTAAGDNEQRIMPQAAHFLWILLASSVTSLFTGLVILGWSSPKFSDDIGDACSDLRNCLSANVLSAFAESAPTAPELQQRILRKSVILPGSYELAAFELRIGRVAVKALKPLIGTVEHVRRELAWGHSFPKPSYHNSPLEDNLLQTLFGPANELAESISDSLQAVEIIIQKTFRHAIVRCSLDIEKQALNAAKARLFDALETAGQELKSIWKRLEPHQRDQRTCPPKVFDLCLFMISLLQIAHEMRFAVLLVSDVVSTYESSPIRLWYPRFTAAWLGTQPRTLAMDEHDDDYLADEVIPKATNLSVAERRQGLTDNEIDGPEEDTGVRDFRSLAVPSIRLAPSWIIRQLWNHPAVLDYRSRLSMIIRSIQHSSHLRYALKNGAGVALLSIPAFTGASARTWFTDARGQWALISYVWVLETSSGATWRVGYLRLSGTVAGGIYAYIAAVIAGLNPYALVTLATLAQVPVSLIVMRTSFPSLGVVFSIALPPIIFAQYFHPEPAISSLKLALLRVAMIGVGIIGALFMNSLIFPRHCRVIFLQNTHRTIGLITQVYLGLSKELFANVEGKPTTEDKRRTIKLELAIRNTLHRMQVLISTMNDEFSLIPKPMKTYRQVVSLLQKLLDLMTGLRKVREHIPRTLTVRNVAAERHELVSSICIALFACEQGYQSRKPIPQFLPSMREALSSWEVSAAEHITTLEGISLCYAFAEIDALSKIVETLEELLSTTRQLYGSAEWLSDANIEDLEMSALLSDIENN